MVTPQHADLPPHQAPQLLHEEKDLCNTAATQDAHQNRGKNPPRFTSCCLQPPPPPPWHHAYLSAKSSGVLVLVTCSACLTNQLTSSRQNESAMKTKRAWAQQDPSEGTWCCHWPGTHSPELHPDSKCHRRALTPRVSSRPSRPPISMTAFPSPCPPTLPPSPCAHLGSQQPRLILQQRLKLTHGPTQVNPPTPVQGSTVGGSQRGSEPPPPPPPLRPPRSPSRDIAGTTWQRWELCYGVDTDWDPSHPP